MLLTTKTVSHYGAYRNANKLTHEEMLQVFWKILKKIGYDVSNFTSNTSLEEPINQKMDWDDFGDVEFVIELEDVFDLSKDEIFHEKHWLVKIFGEFGDHIWTPNNGVCECNKFYKIRQKLPS